jgi:hypothetical protein
MAVNSHTFADQEGEHSDWIEIFNPNSSSVNLEGWYLTDDAKMLNKWRLPATKIKGHGYVVVFASEKDRSVAGAELHTNFKLDGHGEFLALVKPDGTTVSFQFAPTYPAQVTGVSFGVDSAHLRAAPGLICTNALSSTISKSCLRYFTTPTPGAANKDGLAGLAISPRFSKPGGVYMKSLSVELSAKSSAGMIRYTLDGSEPTAASTLYAGPIEITATAALKARTFERGLAPSMIAAQTYTIADDSMSAFTSNLPLVIIDTSGRRIGRETKTPVGIRFIEAAPGKRTSLAGAADFDGQAHGVGTHINRGKGWHDNSSTEIMNFECLIFN